MTSTTPDAGQELAGQHVAVTGRLASMPRREFVSLVERHGGQFSPHVCRQTTLIVVGREGFPLGADGRPSSKLRRVRELQHRGQRLEIVPEERFLRHLQQPQLVDDVCQTYTMAELTKLLDVPRSRIESWRRLGLLRPAAEGDELPRFDFRQVAAARSLAKLLGSGVKPQRLRRSVSQLRAWRVTDEIGLIPPVLHDSGCLAFRTDAGRLIEGTGQLLIEFDDHADDYEPTVAWTAALDADRLFEEAVQLEQQGQLAEAARCYRQLLLEEGPDADVCFNLANTLVELGETAAAIERLYEAVTLEREDAAAWHNLGRLLSKQDRLDEAVDAYHRAVALEPEYADALFGLADVLEQLGRPEDARVHWRAFLKLEPAGSFADYARQRLAQLA